MLQCQPCGHTMFFWAQTEEPMQLMLHVSAVQLVHCGGHAPPGGEGSMPQNGILQLLVSKLQFAVQASMPVMKPCVRQVLPPRSLPSHCSGGLI